MKRSGWVRTGSGPTGVQIYHRDLAASDNPCTLVTELGVFMLINAQGEPQVVSLPEMAFLLDAALRLNADHSG